MWMVVDQQKQKQMVRSYKGRKNVQTFLKEIATMHDDNFFATGCDSGKIVFWHRDSPDPIHMVFADQMIVNGVKPHPFTPDIASCGIDSDVKIWRLAHDEKDQSPSIFHVATPARSMFYRRANPPVLSKRESFVHIQEVMALSQRAKTRFSNKKFSEAASIFSEEIASWSFRAPTKLIEELRVEGETKAHLNRSQCYVNLEKWNEVKRDTSVVLMREPDNIKALYRRSLALFKSGEIEEAISDCQHLLSLDPTNTPANKLLESLQKPQEN